MAEIRPVAGILFDWGETLVNVPGMIHSAERHLACVERMYCNGATKCPAQRYGVTWPAFREAYLQEVARQIARSTESGREHSFEDRLAGTLAQLGIQRPSTGELSALVDSLGEHIVADVTLVDGVREVVPELARHYRLGIVSNYPCAPLVARSMERFGLLECFSAIVVSGEWGFTKPHPGIYREALRRIDVALERALFVGDDLANDVRGPKAVGMRALWFAPHSQPGDAADADGHILDLRELLPWCREHLDA
ncbi:MAG TPA: HAD family hydrolase [Casimicrobiaceae bacterium]|nr:HAD family hydrolase [Casimicrobiaceae bacterium]